MLEKDTQAPDFTLTGDDEKLYSLQSFSGKTLVLYFYPKDNTSGCTTEAQEFSALHQQFADKNAVIVGVSPDSIKSHKNFKEKAGINFLLLSDPDKKVATAYEAYGEKMLYGKLHLGIIRSTYVIRDGKIINAWTKVKAAGHAEAVLGCVYK